MPIPVLDTVGVFGKIFLKVFSFFTDEDKLRKIQKRWQGDRLEKAATEALRTWKENQTDANWTAYEAAVAELESWAHLP